MYHSMRSLGMLLRVLFVIATCGRQERGGISEAYNARTSFQASKVDEKSIPK